MMEEIWKDVPIIEGYQVSNLGRVRSKPYYIKADYMVHSPLIKKGGSILKGVYDNDGYRRVHLRRNGRNIYISVHRLVAMSFIPNPENKGCIDHINAVKDDNRVENLRWVTVLENQNNVITKRRISESKKKPLIMYDTEYNPIKRFSSLREAGKFMQSNPFHISKACTNGTMFKGKYWKFEKQLEAYKEYA